MRILQVKTSAGRGGAETLLLDLTRVWLSRGHSSAVVLFEDGWLAARLADAGVPVAVLPWRRRRLALIASRLRRVVRSYRPDVVLCHGACANVMSTAAAAWTQVPIVSVEHGIDPWRAQSRLLNLVDRWCGRTNARRIAVSGAVAEMLRTNGIVRPDRIEVIPNAVSLVPVLASREEVRHRLGLRAEEVVAVTVARLVAAKGHADLLEAADLLVHRDGLRHLRLLFVGEGPLRSQLEQQAQRLGLQDRVLFTGGIDGVPGMLPACDLFVLPSRAEGMPVALLEAMAARLPLVATAVAGVPEIVRHQETGLLVPPADPEALAHAIATLAASRVLRETLGNAAGAYVRREHDISIAADRYLRVLAAAAAEVRGVASPRPDETVASSKRDSASSPNGVVS